jgi:enoyl-CoA hydratase
MTMDDTTARADAEVADVVLYERREHVGWITLNRPRKINAISRDVLAGLDAALARVGADDEVRVVVLTGSGGNFSAGYDISGSAVAAAPDAAGAHRHLAAEVATTMRVWGLEKPTIAAVDGWCLAGGCELALACDMAIATEDARFGMPEIRYGSGPVTLLMPFILGQKKTNELLFTGDTVAADEARRLGLVNHVVPRSELRNAVETLAAKVVPTPLPVLKFTKVALNRAYEAMGLRVAVNANLDVSAILNKADTPEAREFQRLVNEEGLRAALRWRDERYGGGLGGEA